jgi:hypothetical protein
MLDGKALIARLVCVFMALLPASSAAEQAAGPDWVVMVFMNGDNDLERDALADFAEMAQVGSDARVKLLVQFDRNGGFATTTPQWTQTLRFEITRGMQPLPQNALEDLGEVNMGTPEALADFVRWGKRRYPAARSAVIVWDHGQGYRLRLQRTMQAARAFAATSAAPSVARAPRPAAGGSGGYRSISDDLTDGDKLYNAEVSEAFMRALGGSRIDLLGFDACLMAMVETAYAMRTHARVMVGSEDLEPGEGWRYDHWLSRLVDQPGVSAEQLGELLVDSYGATTGTRAGTTLSSITLTGFEGVASAISTLSDRLIASLATELQTIAAARASCRNYAPDLREIYHIDMIRFARELANRSSDPELARVARAAADALDATVIRRFAHADREGEFGSHGLSIYFPATHHEFESDPFQEAGYIKNNTFFPVPFVRDHRWADFLQAYYDGSGGTPGTVPAPQPQPVSAPAAPSDPSLERLARKVTTQASVLSGLRETSTTSHVDSGEPMVVLLASNDGVTAKARMGYLVHNKSLVDVTFTGPVSGGHALLLTRRGLGNKASVEVGATFVPWTKTTIRNENGIAVGTRFRSAESSFAGLVADTATKASAAERTRLQAAAAGRQGFRGIAAAPIPAEADGLRRAFSDLWRREVLGTGKVQVHSAMIASGTYTSGANTFTFRDPSTLEPGSISVRSEGLVGSVGWLQAQGASFAEAIPRAYFGFSVEGSRSFTPQAAKNICTPLTDDGALDCASLSVGEPDVDRVLSYQGEARVWLRARTLAVAARYTYEEQRRGPRKPTRLVEFPFYFLKKVAKIDEMPKPGEVPPFTGGVNVGWRTENRERSFFIVLFVGSTFGLPGIP